MNPESVEPVVTLIEPVVTLDERTDREILLSLEKKVLGVITTVEGVLGSLETNPMFKMFAGKMNKKS